MIIVAAPRAHGCVRGPVRKAARARPLNVVVRRQMNEARECSECGAIFSAAVVRDAEGKCSVCGGDLKQLVNGDKGKSWIRTDTFFFLTSFPGSEVLWAAAIILGCLSLFAATR